MIWTLPATKQRQAWIGVADRLMALQYGSATEQVREEQVRIINRRDEKKGAGRSSQGSRGEMRS